MAWLFPPVMRLPAMLTDQSVSNSRPPVRLLDCNASHHAATYVCVGCICYNQQRTGQANSQDSCPSPLPPVHNTLVQSTKHRVCVVSSCQHGDHRFKTLLGPLEAIFQKPETTIEERLQVSRGGRAAETGAHGHRASAGHDCRNRRTRQLRFAVAWLQAGLSISVPLPGCQHRLCTG